MVRTLRRAPTRFGRWLLSAPPGRLTLGLAAWGLILAAFSLVASADLWVAFAFGATFPVSLWMAWRGYWWTSPSHMDRLLDLSGSQFEDLVADLLKPLGYRDVRVVGGADDLGVDVLGRDANGSLVAIQCKRYLPDRNISASAVQTFMGGMVAHRADKGIIVTSSSFSRPARDLATQQGIRLIDGVELIDLIQRHNVSTEE